MRKRPINLYTSDSSVGQFQSFARLLGENMEQPVHLYGLSDLPAPDTTRPTRQQLRTERAELERDLGACSNLLQLYKSSPRLAEQAEYMRQEMVRYNNRIQEIDQVLGPEGGPQHA